MDLTHTSELINFQTNHVIKKLAVIFDCHFLLLLTRLPVKADRLKCSPDLKLRWHSV